MDFKELIKKAKIIGKKSLMKNKKESSLVDDKTTALVVKKKKSKPSYITIENEDPIKPEKYYIEKSKLFGVARYIATGALVIFILIMFSFFGDQFTGENFRYLLKHIDMNSSGVIDEFKTVVYDRVDGTVFCEYQQDFVIAAPGSLKIYDYKGVMTLNSLPTTNKPRIISSERYILLYDRGDKDYYIYNSFSLLRQRELPDNIIMADISDSGNYVIVTESLEYAAHMYVYNDNFELISEIKKNRSVSGVCISEDGKRLAVTSFELSPDTADYVSILTVYSLDDSSIQFEKTIDGELPVSVMFDNDGGVKILTGEKFRTYDSDGNERTVNIDVKGSSMFAMSPELCAYSSAIGSGINNYAVSIIDSPLGRMCGNVEVEKSILSLEVGGDYVFILTENALYRTDKYGHVDKVLLNSPVGMVVSPEGNVFVCYESRAELIKF